MTFPPGGLYRDQMFARALSEGFKWYTAFSGSSLPNVLTAVEAGLGLSLLPLRTAKDRKLRLSRLFGTEPGMVTSLYAWEGDGPAAPLVAAMGQVLAHR